jgi:hypothetical protein
MNEVFQNNLIAERYVLHGAISKVLEGGDSNRILVGLFFDEDLGLLNQGDSMGLLKFPKFLPFPFRDDGGNWLLDTYTVPADGVYTFNYSMIFEWLGASVLLQGFGLDINEDNAIHGVTVDLVRQTSGGVDIQVFDKYKSVLYPNTPEIATDTVTLFAQAGEKIILRGTYTANIEELVLAQTGGIAILTREWNYKKESTFQTLATFDGGGFYKEADGDNYFITVLDFEAHLNEEQIDLLLNNPVKAINVNSDGVSLITSNFNKQ